MKYIIYIILLLMGARLFLPDKGQTGIQNLPLLIFILSCVLLYFIILGVKRCVAAQRIKKLLEASKLRIKHFSVIPAVPCKSGRYDIVTEDRRLTLNIKLLMRKRSYYRYHFNGVSRLEMYTGTRNGVHIGRNGVNRVSVARASNVDTTNCVARRKLPFTNPPTPHTVDIIVMDKFPNAVTDSMSRYGLGNGDVICGQVRLFDMEGFKAFLTEI